jgi:hypothetical protein
MLSSGVDQPRKRNATPLRLSITASTLINTTNVNAIVVTQRESLRMRG